MANIENKLNELLLYLNNFQQENGFPPSVREICAHLSIKSTATCQYYINKLVERGHITKMNDKKRSLKLNTKSTTSFSVPLIGTITAGTPIFAVENLEGYYPIPNEFSTSSETFMLHVKGDSMQNAGILNGDKIIVKKQETANNGDIVVAFFDDSATVKRFYKKDNKFILHPENEKYDDIELDNVMILGVVEGLIRKL